MGVQYLPYKFDRNALIKINLHVNICNNIPYRIYFHLGTFLIIYLLFVTMFFKCLFQILLFVKRTKCSHFNTTNQHNLPNLSFLQKYLRLCTMFYI